MLYNIWPFQARAPGVALSLASWRLLQLRAVSAAFGAARCFGGVGAELLDPLKRCVATSAAPKTFSP